MLALVTLPVAFNTPTLAVPLTNMVLVALSNLKLVEAPALPALLNNTSVLLPGTTRLPLILPANVPKIVPVTDRLPPTLALLPTAKLPPDKLPV